LFAGFCSELKPTEEKYTQFTKSVETSLKSIFENTTGFVPLMMGAVFEISLKMELELHYSLVNESM